MKQLSFLSSIFIFFILSSCSNEEPDYPVFMQPSSIQSADANADNQTFEYDDYGRIIAWNYTSNRSNDPTSYSAHYSYPDENTIKVTAEEVWTNQHRLFEESIQLNNGRATKSEGTYVYTFIDQEAGNSQMRKTYRLVFDYLPDNHLNTVEHIEVLGIGDDLKDTAWDNAWKWMNYLIWENGNLKEFQDYQCQSTAYQSTKYEYYEDKVSYPIIIPMVINSAYHMPLFMQGVFGSNSTNLVKSASLFDNNASLYLSRDYSYELEQDRISKYTETLFTSSVYSNPVTYTVNWTER